VEQHFFKSFGIAIAEVLPSSCEIAIADSKKSCACPPLIYSSAYKLYIHMSREADRLIGHAGERDIL
jgi:hypothetical protein